jgi:transposase InsO family protein
VARGLKLRHDHGSNYMSSDFQDEIECLGIEASPSFVRQPEGNGGAERFIRTLKENLLWVTTSTPSKSCEPHSSSLPLATTKLGSSLGTAIVPQPR